MSQGLVKCSRRLLWMLLLLQALCIFTAQASTLTGLTSEYEGDGWFKYTIHLPTDPFWSSFSSGQVTLPFPSGSTEMIALSDCWTNAVTNGESITFTRDTSKDDARPVDYVFRLKSSYTTFRTLIGATTISFSMTPMGWRASPFISLGMVGYNGFETLVPCPPEEADGSDSVLDISRQDFPDVVLDGPITKDSQIIGVNYHWPGPATYILQGSQDLKQWNDIASITNTTGGQSAWIPTVPIANQGPYYRLRLTSFDLSGRGSVVAKAATGTPTPVTGLVLVDGGLQVSFAAAANSTYEVQVTDISGTVLYSKSGATTGTNQTVALNQAPSGFVKVLLFPAAGN